MEFGAETSDKFVQVAEEVRREATLPNESDVGKPLPLAAHWNSGQKPNGFSPGYQMDMMARGYHLLPWFTLPVPGQAAGYEYYEAAIKKAAKLHLPISFVSTQWESLLSYDPRYLNLPANQNPNVIDSSGKVIPEVCPFGPVALWREVGIKWTSSLVMRKLQEWYPDPPFVLFVSNNEHPKLQWKEAENSQRFVALFGKGRSGSFKRRVIGDGWIQCYRSLQDGMRKGLTASRWKEKAVFIGFNAFGTTDFGRQADWMNNSLYVPGRFEPWPLAWGGACASCSVDNNVSTITDYTVFSPQIGAINSVFMQKETNALNPAFWFEQSVWDGHEQVAAKDKRRFYALRGQVFSPERYGGMVKFDMWVLRPRVVREYRYWDDTVKESGAYFLAVADAVEMIHANPTLRKFWRHGRLVANNQRQHPYQINVPEEYRNVERWFLLDTSLDPPRPWEMSTELPVFALGLVLGESPEREWLVYAHSPLKDRKNVEIVLPGYGPLRIDVGPAGNYYHVVEKGKETKPIL